MSLQPGVARIGELGAELQEVAALAASADWDSATAAMARFEASVQSLSAESELRASGDFTEALRALVQQNRELQNALDAWRLKTLEELQLLLKSRKAQQAYDETQG